MSLSPSSLCSSDPCPAQPCLRRKSRTTVWKVLAADKRVLPPVCVQLTPGLSPHGGAKDMGQQAHTPLRRHDMVSGMGLLLRECRGHVHTSGRSFGESTGNTRRKGSWTISQSASQISLQMGWGEHFPRSLTASGCRACCNI